MSDLSVLIHRPSHRHRVQLRSFNPAMFTILDTDHRQHCLSSSCNHHHIQDFDTKYRLLSTVGKGPSTTITTTTTPKKKVQQNTTKYLSSKHQQAPLAKAKSFVGCWCKLCFDSRQNSINHESLFQTTTTTTSTAPPQLSPPLVNDPEKAACPIILAIDDNGNETCVYSGGCSAEKSSEYAIGPCATCQRHATTKNAPLPSTDVYTAPGTFISSCAGPEWQPKLLVIHWTLTRDEPSTNRVETNNNNWKSSSLAGEEHEEIVPQLLPKRHNKRAARIRHHSSYLKRWTRPKVSPLKLVSMLFKYVKILPADMIGQEMELGLIRTATASDSKNSKIVFRIVGAGDGLMPDMGDRTWGVDGATLRNNAKRDLGEGGGRHGASELKVMDCALQPFNSRNCNDFLYSAIQSDPGQHAAPASSGNRYNMPRHEFPRGTVVAETQNSCKSDNMNERRRQSRVLKGGTTLHRREAVAAGGRGERNRFKEQARQRKDGVFFETAEKKLQMLCHCCRELQKPQLEPEFQRSCLGCNQRIGFYRRRDDSGRSLGDLAPGDGEYRLKLKARQKEVLIDLQTNLLQFQLQLQTRLLFFGRFVSLVSGGNRFAYLFNIDVLQSGSIRFRFHVSGAERYVQFLCRGNGRTTTKTADSGGLEVAYIMCLKSVALGEISSELVEFHVTKYAVGQSENGGDCSADGTIPECLVS